MHFYNVLPTMIVFLLRTTIASSYTINLNDNSYSSLKKVYYRNSRNPYGSKYYEDLINRKTTSNMNKLKYPISNGYYEEYLKRLNSKNASIQTKEIINNVGTNNGNGNGVSNQKNENRIRVLVNNKNILDAFGIDMNSDNNFDTYGNYLENGRKSKKTKSENFEIVSDVGINFKNVGGYNSVKDEMMQCVDMLTNYSKYNKYNVRIPKGMILEGPPGTGKTLLSKAFAGEANCSFIAVSGSDFQEKYVGVGSTRMKELFRLAKDNIPCIIFIDEIDAVGKKRSSDGESSSSERDTTLNALLVELDGFKDNAGIFMISATNRIDLLDPALTRPGRIDKKIFIGLPDSITRESIIDIHMKGKPQDGSIKIPQLIETTDGLTGAQIENLLNEAMLNALRKNKDILTMNDFDLVLNKMMAGWQPNEHVFTNEIIDHIAIHEMGHAIVGILSKHHSKMSKVVINFSSPKSPGYTIFETSTSTIHTRESLFEHLMILLAGRISEEIFYGKSVTTGAINDFEEALRLSQKMVLYYGMGTNVIYPSSSDKYKEMIDNDVTQLINKAYNYAEMIVSNSKDLIRETSDILKVEKMLHSEYIINLINSKYPELNTLKIEFQDDEP
jgi:cell division protease FtsH